MCRRPPTQVLEQRPGDGEQDDLPDERAEKIGKDGETRGVGRGGDEEPREQQNADIKRDAADAMGDRHRQCHRPAVNAQMRRQWPRMARTRQSVARRHYVDSYCCSIAVLDRSVGVRNARRLRPLFSAAPTNFHSGGKRGLDLLAVGGSEPLRVQVIAEAAGGKTEPALEFAAGGRRRVGPQRAVAVHR